MMMEKRSESLESRLWAYISVNADNRKVIESKANEKEWRNECERVKKYLENISTLDQKEWRHHIEKSKELSDKIQTDVCSF